MENTQIENTQEYDYSILSNDKEFIDDVDDVLDVEHKINESKQAKPISMLKSEQCTIANCNIKEDNRNLKDALVILRKKVTSLTREKELFDRAIVGEISDDQKEILTIKAIQSPFVQSMKQRTQELDSEIKILRKTLADQSEENTELKEQQKEFYTAYELDNKYSTKYRQFKQLEKRYDILLDKENALQLKHDEAEILFSKLAKEHNDKLAEFKQLEARIKIMGKALKSQGTKKISLFGKTKRRGSKNPFRAFFRV